MWACFLGEIFGTFCKLYLKLVFSQKTTHKNVSCTLSLHCNTPVDVVLH